MFVAFVEQRHPSHPRRFALSEPSQRGLSFGVGPGSTSPPRPKLSLCERQGLRLVVRIASMSTFLTLDVGL